MAAFHRADFVECLVKTLGKGPGGKGYGPKKTNEAVDYFDRQSRIHEARGIAPDDAAVKALTDTFINMEYLVQENAKRARKNLSAMAENAARVQSGAKAHTSYRKAIFGGLLGGADSPGNAFAHAVMSNIEKDDRFSGLNVGATYRAWRGVFFRNIDKEMGGGLAKFAKGAFGKQLGAMHDMDVLRELYFQSRNIGKATGNAQAAAFARGILATDDLIVDTFNNSGGTLRKLTGYILPQGRNAVKVLKNKQRWLDVMNNERLDWNEMRWPDGTSIQPAERPSFLEHVWNTLRTDGGADIEPSVGHGQGRALGNMLDKHRVLIFKDAESWMADHKEFGDGNFVWDVLAAHVDRMAHKTAIVRHFGQNPELMAETFVQQGRKAASDIGKKPNATARELRAKDDFNAAIPRFDDMIKVTLHTNAMNPDSALGVATHMTTNLMTPALLGGVAVLGEMSDMVTTIAVRFANHQPLLNGLSMHIKGMTTDFKGMQEQALQTGVMYDQQTASNFATQRYTGVATYGPAWSRAVGDFSMRLGGANRQVTTTRATAQFEQMAALWRNRNLTFDKLPDKAVFTKYGITPAMWDDVRNAAVPYERNGAKFFSPPAILDLKNASKEDLFLKFSSMIDGEARDMVPAATLEAAVSLRGTTRPDTLAGAILHSFSMFKNYPLSIYNMYGRRLLAMPDTTSRLKFIAALGIGMIGAGALVTQMREISSGRTPIDMSRPDFWAKAVMVSGGLSIWGDFLFGGNAQGSTFVDTAAGPLAGLASDMIDVTAGSAFKWIDVMDPSLPFGGKWQSKILEFTKRYNPVASNWYLKLALQREVFDQLQRFVDPIGARQREIATVNRQKQAYGNTYISPPGVMFGGR